jgi:hypothetical protein
VERFVQEHRAEPGFAFAVQAPGDLDPLWDHWKGYVVHSPDSRKSISELLYPAYYDASILKTGPDRERHRYLLDRTARAPN